MMTDTFPISHDVLEWIKRTITLSSLPALQQHQFHQWIEQKVQPTYDDLETFSKKAKIPFGYLFMSNPPIEEIPLIQQRTNEKNKTGLPGRDFVDIYYQMKSIQDWMIDYLEFEGAEDLRLPGRLPLNADIHSITSSMRSLLELPDDFLIEMDDSVYELLKQRIRNLGVLVIQSSMANGDPERLLNPEEFRGFALFDQKAPLIFINSRDILAGQIFTLLHEFLYVLTGTDDLFVDENCEDGVQTEMEQIFCAAVAELMIPSSLFREQWRLDSHETTKARIASLTRTFHEHETLVTRQALASGLIDTDQYQEIKDQFGKTISNTIPGENDPSERMTLQLDPVFLLALADSVAMGKTTYTEAFRLTNTTAQTFDQICSEALEAISTQL